MSSISSMPYAARKSNSGWIKENAEEIRRIRLHNKNNSFNYDKIRDSFRCYGCYEAWEKKYNREPHEQELPTLTHYTYKNSDETHFKLRRSSQEESHEHMKGCYFNDPTDYYRELSNVFDYVGNDEKKAVRLNILNQLELTPIKENTLSKTYSGKTGKNRATHLQSFGALQDVYNRYQENWKELSVTTEDDENIKIGNLLHSPAGAKQLATNNQNKIIIVSGFVQKVEKRNNGGFINVVFKHDSSESFPPFRLSVSPYHIYNEEDLKCLENRKIGCYGRLNYNKGFAQMDFFSLHHQIVFLDLKENESCPFTLPTINFDRLHTLITKTLENYTVKSESYHPEVFSYYLRRKSNIPQIEGQVKQNRIDTEALLQEKVFKVQQKEEAMLEQERLIMQQTHTKKKLNHITSTLKEERKRINNKVRKWIRTFYTVSESPEIQTLVSKHDMLEKKLNSYKEQEQEKLKDIINLNDSIIAIQSIIKNLDQSLSNELNTIEEIKKGLHVEGLWRSHLKKENCLLFHHSMENVWIAIQINHSTYPSSGLEFSCLFQYHYKNNNRHIHSEKMKNIQFVTPSYDLMIYKIIKNKLHQHLTHSPIQKYRVKEKRNKARNVTTFTRS
ncbi:hypothetical protein [Bacillus thuringiensis]|uniref:hypothetical protein n=1 Tax=Bacillus thuringiensis TaxID=1428 RepID=UPI0005CF774B|nr:hypothetical protein [Bacillus thuringiensis]